MRIRHFLIAAVASLLFASVGHADAPLKSSLGLNTDQAREVKAIQKQYRRQFSAARQELHREQRKLRRARIAEDGAEIARLEQTTAKLEDALRQVRLAENEQIRQLLTPEQRQKFEQVIRQRRDAVGSSRDAKIFKS